MRAHRALRVTTALAIAAAMSFIGVQSVSAEVSGTIRGYTAPVNLTFEGGNTVGASLITLTTLDGDELLTYCIDLNTHTGNGVTYDEGSWTEASVPDVAKVTAILQASYPVRTVDQLSTATGLTLTENEAIAGTQAAIWHFTDLVNLSRTVQGQGTNSNIGKLYDYLLDVANSPVAEPAPSLEISPATTSGTVGTLAGPFTLHVSPASATVTVTADPGVAFVDDTGNPIVPTANGQTFWVTQSTAGTFQIRATAEVAVPTGRVFLHTATQADPDSHQKLVLAKSGAVTTNATASFEATPVPTTTTVAETTTTTTEAATTTTTVAPTTTQEVTTTTTEVPTTEASTTTVVPTTVETTTTAPPIVLALVPVSTPPTSGGIVELPATGSSSTLPGLVLAAGTVLLGMAITAMTRRRTVN
jgi:TQXA domain-containing protein